MYSKLYILLLIVLLAPLQAMLGSEDPRAVEGVLDLREYDFIEKGVLEVKGEWLFFWEEILDPSDHDHESGYLIDVPSTWGQLKEIVPGIEKKGFATYHLKILFSDNVQRMAFRFTEVFSGSGYYVNGKNIGFSGFPGANPFQVLIDTRPSLFTAELKDHSVDLVVHVSNFKYRSGGMKGEIELGYPMQVMEERAARQHRDFFFLGAFLIIGIFFMGMFLIHADVYKLFFSLICILFAFRLLLLSESGYMDWLSGIAYLRLDNITFSLMVPLFIMMIRHLFPHDFPRLLFKIVSWICIVMILVMLVSPVSLFSEILVYYYIFICLLGLVLLYVVYQTMRRGRSFAIGYAIGVIVVIAGTLNDVLIVADVIETKYVAHYAMFVYVLIYALIFSLKSNDMLHRSKQLSLDISEVNENLESLVEERTRELSMKSREIEKHQLELEDRNAKLQQMVSIRNRFFTIIGHDIRGPIGYTGQMLDFLIAGNISKEEELKILTLLSKSSQASMNLLENLLIWGRSQIGNMTANSEKFKFLLLINETVELFDHALQEKSLALKIDVEAMLTVFADKEQIKMLVRNLLSNAVKFTNTGGSISIEASAADDGKETVLKITDTGIGIPAVLQERLFSSEEFYTTVGTSDEKGSGLGLKLCHEITELNKGWITLESKTGKGSVFTVGLPSGA